MSSKYVKDLYRLADQLEQDGFPVSAATCRNGGIRMERMEILIVDQQVGVPEKEAGKG